MVIGMTPTPGNATTNKQYGIGGMNSQKLTVRHWLKRTQKTIGRASVLVTAIIAERCLEIFYLMFECRKNMIHTKTIRHFVPF